MSEITVVEHRTRVTVEHPDGLAVIARGGPSIVVSPVGAPGPPGASGIGFNFTQSTPAATWTINHNLGFRPGVALMDVGGNALLAEVVHVSANQCVAYFLTAIAGTARLS